MAKSSERSARAQVDIAPIAKGFSGPFFGLIHYLESRHYADLFGRPFGFPLRGGFSDDYLGWNGPLLSTPLASWSRRFGLFRRRRGASATPSPRWGLGTEAALESTRTPFAERQGKEPFETPYRPDL